MTKKPAIIPVRLNPEIPSRALSGGQRTLLSRQPCPCYRKDTGSLGSTVFFHSEKQDLVCDGWKHLLELIEKVAVDEGEEFNPLEDLTLEERRQIVTLPPSIGTLIHVRNFNLHSEKQDLVCDGWKHLLELIEKVAVDEGEEFNPLEDLTLEERRQIVTLPPSIGTLIHVRNFNLYDSALVRIPPEIGDMTSLEVFTPYTSYRLHWFPFEITRCKKLTKSTVSTRALYGNYHFRPPFPELQPDRESIGDLDLGHLSPDIWGADAIIACSVCNRPLKDAGLHQVWISLWVAAYDVLPLLVNACSPDCIRRLPTPPQDYVQGAHKGGLQLKQPPQDPHYAY